MKTCSVCICVALSLVVRENLRGQEFDLESFFVVPGGQVSSGGDYWMVGTLGQTAAAELVGGDFQMVAGLRSGVIEDAQTAPLRLDIRRLPSGALRLSWAPYTSSQLLQSTETLLHARWIDVPQTTGVPLEIVPSGTTRFFRVITP